MRVGMPGVHSWAQEGAGRRWEAGWLSQDRTAGSGWPGGKVTVGRRQVGMRQGHSTKDWGGWAMRLGASQEAEGTAEGTKVGSVSRPVWED